MLIDIIDDISDPWEVFLAVSDQPYPFILENNSAPSFEGNPFSYDSQRLSLVGCDPFLVVKAWQNRVEVFKEGMKEVKIGDPFLILDCIISGLISKCKGTVPLNKRDCPPLCGAAVGYFGYDLKNLLETLPRKTPYLPFVPDMLIGIYDTLFVYDHNAGRGYIISTGIQETDENSRRISAERRLKDFKKKIRENNIVPISGDMPMCKDLVSNFTRQGYIGAVKRAKSYISSGDIYQINLSQRFRMIFYGDPKLFYSRLRSINPVSFGAFMDLGDFHVISNSPECFLRLDNGIVETYPIKGTRPRGDCHEKDELIMQELKTNAKELAEHIMIVDLERNDIGKVCMTGTVRVTELGKVVTYPTLHHMVSCVSGRIKDNVTPIECLKSCFPGGSITGAPKIRAMEIIEEIEPTSRGIYTGAIGYIDFYGNMNLGMAIRTAVVSGGEMHLSVGGGIVADSVPEDEYEETLLKAEAFFRAMRS